MAEGREWDQALDAPRFRRAFATLCRTRRNWPLPQDFLDALPPREQLALTKEFIPADPERVRRMMEELARELRA